MWSHHSYRSWQWISPDLLPGRPCKVLSWVSSVELAVTLWVLSPRAGGGGRECMPQPLPLPRRCFIFPTLVASSFSHCFHDYIPWISEYESLINPGQPKPSPGVRSPLTLVESSFWLIFQKIYFPVWDTSLKQERKNAVIAFLPSWPLCSLPSSPLLTVRASSEPYLPRSANREKILQFSPSLASSDNITFL